MENHDLRKNSRRIRLWQAPEARLLQVKVSSPERSSKRRQELKALHAKFSDRRILWSSRFPSTDSMQGHSRKLLLLQQGTAVTTHTGVLQMQNQRALSLNTKSRINDFHWPWISAHREAHT